MSKPALWLLFLAIGLGTFSLRFSFIYLFGRIEIPGWVRRALRFVPSSVLAALVFPAMLYQGSKINLGFSNFHLVAGLAGAVVAWRTKNVLYTILTGMAVLWLLQAFWGA
jgi:branched-subunit amino acid transport protein